MIPVMIVPTLIHYEYLQNMLDSVDYPIDKIIIIDNGGKLKSLKCSYANKIDIINFPANLGVASSWNLGIKLTPYSKWWLIASDDVVFKPGVLKRIDESNFETFIADWSNERVFSCFAIGESVIEQVGLFSEKFYPGFGEDYNYMRRLKSNGVKCKSIKNIFDHINNGGNTLNYLGIGSHSPEDVDKQVEYVSFSRHVFFNEHGNPSLEWDLDTRRIQERFINPD